MKALYAIEFLIKLVMFYTMNIAMIVALHDLNDYTMPNTSEALILCGIIVCSFVAQVLLLGNVM